MKIKKYNTFPMPTKTKKTPLKTTTKKVTAKKKTVATKKVVKKSKTTKVSKQAPKELNLWSQIKLFFSSIKKENWKVVGVAVCLSVVLNVAVLGMMGGVNGKVMQGNLQARENIVSEENIENYILNKVESEQSNWVNPKDLKKQRALIHEQLLKESAENK